MRTFTVHEQPEPPADRLERAEALVFVREGFSGIAAYLAPIWLLAHRLWLPFAGYLAVLAALQGLIWAFGIGQQPAIWLFMGLHLLIGFEADSLRRWSLDRRGFHMVGTVSGRNTAECERRFFEGWLGEQPMVAATGLGGSGGRTASGRLTGLALGQRGS